MSRLAAPAILIIYDFLMTSRLWAPILRYVPGEGLRVPPWSDTHEKASVTTEAFFLEEVSRGSVVGFRERSSLSRLRMFFSSL